MKPDEIAKINAIAQNLIAYDGEMSPKMATAKAVARIVADNHYYRNNNTPCDPQMTLEFEEAATLMCDWILERIKKKLEQL